VWNNEELVAQSFFESYLKHEDFPLDLNRIALAVEQKLGIEVFTYICDLPNEVTAQLRKGDHAALIYVNKNHSLARQRFGVAHEFGHILMGHRHGIPAPGIGESDAEYESANNFSAALLMPAWHVLCLAKKYPDSFIFLVHKVSGYFGVSLEAAARRLAATEVLPGLLTLVDPLIGRLDWEYHSPSIHLDRGAFRDFLVRYFQNPKKREEDLEIMGYPFRIEAKRMWGKYLLTCMPFTMVAAGYGR